MVTLDSMCQWQCLLILLLSVVSATCKLRNGEPHKYSSKAGVCKNDGKPQSCTHQVARTAQEEGSCLLEEVRLSEIEECSRGGLLAAADPLPFTLTAFCRDTIFSNQKPSGLIISFPNLISQSVIFRYSRFSYPEKNMCRKVTLSDFHLPLNGTIFWDCNLYTGEMIGEELNLTIVDDRGRGGLYTFIVPDGNFIDPYDTELEDWHVFQYLHLEHIQQNNMPVTLQLAPSANLTYNVSLLRCQDGFHCNQTILTDNRTVKGPESVNYQEEDSPHETVKFSIQEPGIYKVRTEISSVHCPAKGFCRRSHSPKFVVPQSMELQMSLIIIAGILLIILLLGMTSYYIQNTQKVMYNALRENTKKPTVLLVYHSSSKNSFDLVQKVSTFLKEAGFVSPLMVDIDGTRQNPNNWTSEQLETAERVLFLVPEDLKGESIMPIRDQWEYALRYIHSSRFKQHLNKTAAAFLPSSAAVPREICHLKQFQLYDLTSLINWIHGGTFFERWFVWPSLLRMTNDENSSVSMTDLKQAIGHKSVQKRSVINVMELKPCPEKPLTDEYHKPIPTHAHRSSHFGPSMNLDEELDTGSEFDSDIISIDKLWADHLDYDSSSCEGSLLGDDEFL